MNSPEITANIQQLGELVADAQTILVLQPERPDTDSLCSALILEHLLGDLGKTVVMYCKDELPPYINYFPGIDRLVDEMPDKFDLSILVDAGSAQQVARTMEKYQNKLSAKPFFIIDHHGIRSPLAFPTIDIIDPKASAAGELLVYVARKLNWKLNDNAAALVVSAIMSDTLGLSTPSTTADTVQTVADMMRQGVDLSELNLARLAAGALEQDVFALKGKLLGDVEFLLNGRLALLTVGPDTLKAYAKRYDPAALVIYDMQHVRGVEIAVVIRDYHPKIKLSLRANGPFAAPVAAVFGGGGHPAASGATIESGDVIETRTKIIETTRQVLEPK